MGASCVESHGSNPVRTPPQLASFNQNLKCDFPGRGNALSTAASGLTLQPHSLAATLKSKLAKASLLGEGWGEGNPPQFDTLFRPRGGLFQAPAEALNTVASLLQLGHGGGVGDAEIG
jgi:hypothetical protein